MKRNTLFSFLTVAALGLLTAGPANAQTFTWDGSTDDDWRVPANWDLDNGSYPETGDIAIIPDVATNDPVIDDQNEVVGELRIQRGGLLTITGQTLTLDGTAQHDIVGELRLASSGSNSVLKVTAAVTMDIVGTIVLKASNAVLDLDADVTVSGNGEIKGEHDDAEIQIADGSTLTNSMLINGQMKINGSGTFFNGSTGIVRANGTASAPAVLLLASTLTIDDADTGTPKWEATTDPDAVLQFDVGASCLDGAFLIDGCATLKLDGVTIKTKGDVTKTAGEIVLANGAALFKDLASDCTGGTSVSAGTFGSCP